jgi:hypothetical protein
MKKRLLAFLLVVVLSLASVGIAAAQGGTGLKAVTTAGVTLYAEPNAGSEAVAELSAYSVVTLLGTDASGAWLNVSAAEGDGYIMADSASVLNLPLLAPKVVVATSSAGATALYAVPDFGADLVASLPDGSVGTVLTLMGQWAYVETDAGMGWSIASAWDSLPDGAMQAVIEVSQADVLGVFSAATVGADIVATPANGTLVWELGMEGEFAEVMTADGVTGYALADNLSALPMVMADVQTGAQTSAGLYDAADFGANVLGELEDGTTVTYVSSVDDFWAEIYAPGYGFVYTLQRNLGPKYSVATVQVQDAVVRAGPNDNLYNAVATLPMGSKVIVKGVSANGAWVEVAIQFNEVDFGYNGVSGWMRDFLFKDADGNTDLDTSFLSVTE